MKLLFLIFLIFLTSGCAYVSYDIEEDIKPNEYGLDRNNFKGRVFSVYCEGNEFAEEKDVDFKCRKIISKLAYSKGYNYFTVISKNNDSKKDINSYTTFFNHYNQQTYYHTSLEHSSKFLFVLINKNEIKNYNNYYIVSDYYISPKTKNLKKETINTVNDNLIIPVRADRESEHRKQISKNSKKYYYLLNKNN